MEADTRADTERLGQVLYSNVTCYYNAQGLVRLFTRSEQPTRVDQAQYDQQTDALPVPPAWYGPYNIVVSGQVFKRCPGPEIGDPEATHILRDRKRMFQRGLEMAGSEERLKKYFVVDQQPS